MNDSVTQVNRGNLNIEEFASFFSCFFEEFSSFVWLHFLFVLTNVCLLLLLLLY